MSDDATDSEAVTDSDNVEAGEAADAVETAYGCPVTWSLDQKVIHPTLDRWKATAAALYLDGWNMCVDLTAVDFLTYRAARNLPDGVAPERYEVVANFISHGRRERLRARVQVPADEPVIDSLYEVYPGVDTLEREVFDMFGITFTGHPDPSRILMPEHWEGHPLRKDFATGAIPVQFKGTPPAR